MDTDLEHIIKDNTIVLTPSHIKSYMMMTLQGLEYLHILWILHRVCHLKIDIFSDHQFLLRCCNYLFPPCRI